MPPVCDPVSVFVTLVTRYPQIVWLDNAFVAEQIIAVGTRVLEVQELAELTVTTEPRYGWLDYELGVRHLGLPAAGGSGRFLVPDRWVRFTAAGPRFETAAGADWAAEFANWQTKAPTAAASPAPVAAHCATGDSEYLRQIAECQEWIRRGNSYLACLTAEYRTSTPLDPVATYLALRTANPAHRGGFLRLGDRTLLSISPEEFLTVTGDTVSTSPIKGTRRRDPDPAVDAALAAELAASPKERAENLMITDLCRNDLSRVCVSGSVTVPRLLQVDTFAAVHQLVSTVQGKLRPEHDAADAIRALFPAGSMTGAPKRRTVELLQGLEARKRGAYSGCFGVISTAETRLSMTIRTVECTPAGARIGVGGGITADSDPAAELAEMHLKAQALLAALRQAA